MEEKQTFRGSRRAQQLGAWLGHFRGAGLDSHLRLTASVSGRPGPPQFEQLGPCCLSSQPFCCRWGVTQQEAAFKFLIKKTTKTKTGKQEKGTLWGRNGVRSKEREGEASENGVAGRAEARIG